MNCKIFILTICLIIFSNNSFAQEPKKETTEALTPQESLEFIAGDLQQIAVLLEKLGKQINKAYGQIANNMGLSLTEDQRKLLVSFEILNRAELRLTTLQKYKLDLLKKAADLRSEIKVLENELTDENIERRVSLVGTTDAKALRNRHRAILRNKINGLNRILTEIGLMVSNNDSEIRQTNYIVESIRRRLFPAIQRELPKLDTGF